MPLDLERRFADLQTTYGSCLVGCVRLVCGHKEQAANGWFLSHVLGRNGSAVGQSKKARTDLKGKRTQICMGRGSEGNPSLS